MTNPRTSKMSGGFLSYLLCEYEILGKLRHVKIVVGAALSHQLLVISALFNATVIDHKDPVGIFDGGKTVSDDKAGPAGKQCLDALLYQHFRVGIDAAGGFIKDEDLGHGDHGAGKGDELPLPDGQSCASFL